MFDLPIHINLFISLNEQEYPLKTSNKRTHIALLINLPLSLIEVQYPLKMAYYKTRNAGKRNNGAPNTGGTAEHHRTMAEQRNTTQNTIGTPQNTNVTPALVYTVYTFIL